MRAIAASPRPTNTQPAPDVEISSELDHLTQLLQTYKNIDPSIFEGLKAHLIRYQFFPLEILKKLAKQYVYVRSIDINQFVKLRESKKRLKPQTNEIQTTSETEVQTSNETHTHTGGGKGMALGKATKTHKFNLQSWGRTINQKKLKIDWLSVDFSRIVIPEFQRIGIQYSYSSIARALGLSKDKAVSVRDWIAKGAYPTSKKHRDAIRKFILDYHQGKKLGLTTPGNRQRKNRIHISLP